MCLARSTPHTGSSGAQGLWSEFTAKPQLLAAGPKGREQDCVFFPNPLPMGVKVPPQVGGWVWGLGFIWPPKWVGGYGVWGFLC